MPYTAYTGLVDADVAALYAYFMQGVEAVDVQPPPTELPFPFNLRFSMAAWNLLFLQDQRVEPDPNQPAEWNRGRYLTEVLGHCSMCHTPRNALMAEQRERAYGGARVGAWWAPNISPDAISGI